MKDKDIPPLLREDPTAGTVGPVIGTFLVIGILIFGAWLAGGRLVDRIQAKRSADEAVSSSLSGAVNSAATETAPAAE
ncbi:MAG TPA: hypothetical protein VJJ47_01620 [Candidatus Paceibacterota bacterium]